MLEIWPSLLASVLWDRDPGLHAIDALQFSGRRVPSAAPLLLRSLQPDVGCTACRVRFLSLLPAHGETRARAVHMGRPRRRISVSLTSLEAWFWSCSNASNPWLRSGDSVVPGKCSATAAPEASFLPS